MAETEELIKIYQRLEDAGLIVIAGKKDTAELMVSHDVVPVVRCKDCVHYVNLLGSGSDYRCSIFCGCYDRPYPTNADDFCSYGERKEA